MTALAGGFAALLLLCGAGGGTSLPSDIPGPAFFQALRVADGRLAAIGYRLTTSNLALCPAKHGEIGATLQSLTQFAPAVRPAARAAYGFDGVVGVAAVVATSPAAGVGLMAGDSIASIDGAALATLAADQGPARTADRDRAAALIAAAPAGRRLTLGVIRHGAVVDVAVPVRASCRARFEILLGTGFDAGSDGYAITLGEKFFERLSDDEIAVVVAHELAHNILGHHASLDKAKVDRGILAEFGRNRRLIRQAEDDADAFSLYLLANAGYDPMAAVRFWRKRGGSVGAGLFRSRTHASPKARAAAMEPIARSIAAIAGRPVMPPH